MAEFHKRGSTFLQKRFGIDRSGENGAPELGKPYYEQVVELEKANNYATCAPETMVA